MIDYLWVRLLIVALAGLLILIGSVVWERRMFRLEPDEHAKLPKDRRGIYGLIFMLQLLGGLIFVALLIWGAILFLIGGASAR